jgi:hypothetical protein
MHIVWPLRAVIAGAAGTAVLTLSYEAERRILHSTKALDYDDSLVPGRIVAGILHLDNLTDTDNAKLGMALRRGYGSLFGLWHGALRQAVPEPLAAAVFGTTLMTATFVAFPVLGKTPPPWEWPRDVLLTAFGTHVAYAATVAWVDDVLSADRPDSF